MQLATADFFAVHLGCHFHHQCWEQPPPRPSAEWFLLGWGSSHWVQDQIPSSLRESFSCSGKEVRHSCWAGIKLTAVLLLEEGTLSSRWIKDGEFKLDFRKTFDTITQDIHSEKDGVSGGTAQQSGRSSKDDSNWELWERLSNQRGGYWLLVSMLKDVFQNWFDLIFSFQVLSQKEAFCWQ